MSNGEWKRTKIQRNCITLWSDFVFEQISPWISGFAGRGSEAAGGSKLAARGALRTVGRSVLFKSALFNVSDRRVKCFDVMFRVGNTFLQVEGEVFKTVGTKQVFAHLFLHAARRTILRHKRPDGRADLFWFQF